MKAEQQDGADDSASDSLAGVGTLVPLQPFLAGGVPMSHVRHGALVSWAQTGHAVVAAAAALSLQLSHHGGVTGVSHGDELSRYALSVSESPVTSGDEIADHQVIIRGGQVEAVVVPLEEYRALKALEQREAELYWAVHEARYPSRPGDDAPDGKVYDSMDALLADLGSDG